MAENARRSASISDMMLFLAGVGVSLGCWRFFLDLRSRHHLGDWPPPHYNVMGAVFLLTPISWTLLLLAWRREGRRRLAAHPAAVVGLSCLLIVGVRVGLMVARQLRSIPSARPWDTPFIWESLTRIVAPEVAMTIAAFCLVHAVSGRLRRPKGWIETAGWIVGVGWIITGVASEVGWFFL